MTQRVAVALRMSLMVVCAMAAMVTAPARAEKADREKPINFSAEQPAEVNFEKRVGTLRGNVVITQGTLTIRADRIDFKQNADNSLSATAFGNPVTFRQKKDDVGRVLRRLRAARRVRRRRSRLLELFDRALLKHGSDEIRSNYVSYNSATGIFKAEGRPGRTRRRGARAAGARRVPAALGRRRSSPKGATKGDANGAAEPAARTPPGKEAPAPAKERPGQRLPPRAHRRSS